MSNSSKLIDTFPQEMRKNYVRTAIRRGLVIKGQFPEIAPYDKFYVLMGIDKNLENNYGFFINSNPHPLSSRSMFIFRSQIEIQPGNYDFLANQLPSYVDCHEPYPKNFYDLVNALVESPSKICGHLNSLHLQNIEFAVRDNRSFRSEQKSLLTRPVVLPPNFLT